MVDSSHIEEYKTSIEEIDKFYQRCQKFINTEGKLTRGVRISPKNPLYYPFSKNGILPEGFYISQIVTKYKQDLEETKAEFEYLNKAYTDGKIEHVQLAELARCYRYGYGTEKDVYKAFEFYVKALEFGVIAQGRTQFVLEEFKEFIEQDLKFKSEYNLSDRIWTGDIKIQWLQNSEISKELANSICSYAVATIKNMQHPSTSAKLAYNIADTYEKFANQKGTNDQNKKTYKDKATIIYLRALIDIKASYTIANSPNNTGNRGNEGKISFNIKAVNELIETKIEIIDSLLQSKNIDWSTKTKLKKIQKGLRKLPILNDDSSSEELFTNYRKIKELLAPLASKLEPILNNSLKHTNIDLIDFYEKAIMLGNSKSIKNFLPKLIQLKYNNIDLQNFSIISKKIKEISKIKDLNQRYLALSSFYRDTLKDKEKADQFLLFAAGYGTPLVYSYEFGLDARTPDSIAQEALKDGNPDAIYQLSQFSKPISGIIPKNPYQYIFLLENAAEKGQPYAMVEYGKILIYSTSQTIFINKFRKDPIRAFKFFSDAAIKAGNIDAMIELGICYANGVGIEQNFEQAVNCFLMAIERQKNRNDTINTDTLVQLGLIWDKISDELKKNTLVSLKLFEIFESDNISNITQFQFYEKAYNLDNNNSTAALNLGLCYLYGYHTPQNLEQAFVYFKEAAGIEDIKDIEIFFNNYELNKQINPKNTEALLQVGLCYLYGWGIKQDEKLGFEIIERAANLGNVNAKYQLVMHYQQDLATVEKAKLNTETEKAKLDRINDNITTLLKDIAFNEKDSNAMFQLGSHYMYMSDITQNQEKEGYKNLAIENITEAIKMGNTDAMVYLANLIIYENGIQDLIEKDDKKKAGELYEKLAFYYDKNLNYDQAFIFFNKAYNVGNKNVAFNLGVHYASNGNFDKAFKLFREAADLNNPYAMYNLAECYEFGNGTQKDINKAIEFYTRAADFLETKKQAQAKLKEISKQQPTTDTEIKEEVYISEEAKKSTTNLKFIEDEYNKQDFYSKDDDKSEDDSTEINEKEFISTHSYEEESVENKDSKIEAYSEYDVEKNSRETSKTDLPASKKELKREIKKLKKNRNKLRDQIIKNDKRFSFKCRICCILHPFHYKSKRNKITEQYNETYRIRSQELKELNKKIEEANKRLQKLKGPKKQNNGEHVKSLSKKRQETSKTQDGIYV